jgi:multidrug efflux pump subunit AcrA (membrane-fusion protein)
MKLFKIALIVLMLLSFSTLSLSCGSKENTGSTSEQETATVQRGNLSIDITGVGNLSLSKKENLTFEMEGTVAEVMVEEGDSVDEGQVLATLDTSERQDELTTLQRQVETNKNNLLQAEIDLTSAEDALEQSTSAEYAELTTSQAELNVANAKISLATAQDNYDKAKDRYESNWTVPEWIRDYEQKTAQLAIAQINLTNAEKALAKVPDDIKTECEKKQKELSIAQGKLDDAQKALDEAQKALDDALNASPEITAPFAGFITKVNIQGGDEVKKNTVAIELADPNKFEADILVNETDIFRVQLGGEATVQVDALQTINLPASVTRIAPSATIQSGVVNYEVKVELESLEAIAQQQQETRQETMQQTMESIAAGELPDMLKRAVDEGRITQEQAEEMVKRMQSGEMPSQPAEGQTPSTQEGGQSQIPFTSRGGLTQQTSSEDFQLREGLTVTVSIIVSSRTDVLLVPNGAIFTRQGQSYVKVVSDDGTIEERAITTGITDYTNTEVINGLSEGEKVIVENTTSTTTTTNQMRGPETQFFFGR